MLDDHLVLASIGSVGDALDNALAESFADSYKTELIADRVWRSRAQLEVATVEYLGGFNHDRLHQALGDIPPVEFEPLHAAKSALDGSFSDDRSVAVLSPNPANGLTTRSPIGIDPAANRPILPAEALMLASGNGSGRLTRSQGPNGNPRPLRPTG